MKKLLFILIFCAPARTPAFALVVPIITEVRTIIPDAGTGFYSFKGEAAGKDEATGSSFYKGKVTPEATISEHFMFEKDATKHAVYVVRYNVKNMNTMYLKVMMIMAQKYIDELNAMAQNGKYVGRDYKNDSGANVTEIKDNAGRKAIDYQRTAEQQVLNYY